ncbi:hypothetical protein [Streptomyces chartreusis]|uniref:hypothetical protein n=1 Tax=Streptomyces chartreusis TaxID=1969 RepID=UPI00364D3ADE
MTTPPVHCIPLDSLSNLSNDDLTLLRNEADRLLNARNTIALPGLVLDAVRDALAEDEPEAPAPYSVRFTAKEWDNGLFWDEDDAEVTLADGSTRTLDLSKHPEMPGALTDHASRAEPNDSSTLTVMFEPPAVIPDI